MGGVRGSLGNKMMGGLTPVKCKRHPTHRNDTSVSLSICSTCLSVTGETGCSSVDDVPGVAILASPSPGRDDTCNGRCGKMLLRPAFGKCMAGGAFVDSIVHQGRLQQPSSAMLLHIVSRVRCTTCEMIVTLQFSNGHHSYFSHSLCQCTVLHIDPMRLAIAPSSAPVVLATRPTPPRVGAACRTMRCVARHQTTRYSVSRCASAPEQSVRRLKDASFANTT